MKHQFNQFVETILQHHQLTFICHRFSFQLCRGNRWIEKISLEARPLDCGVGSGLTFSAPVWPTNPPDLIQRIKPNFPNHHASSFFYEEKMNLPPIAYYRLQKIKEYVGVKEKSVKRIHQKYRR